MKHQSPMERFQYFIRERHQIYVKKTSGDPKPWTKDPILLKYRFCNIYRELDTVSKWIADQWRTPNEGAPDLWLAMAVARWINWPETLADMGFPLPWAPLHMIEVLKRRKEEGEKVWTGAYMIGTQGNAKDKPLFIIENVLQPLYEQRERLRPRPTDTLMDFAERIMNVKNQGKFMVGQIVADIKYDKKSPLFKAADWHTFSVSGPGSRRGLNRLLGRDKDNPWNEVIWHQELMKVKGVIDKYALDNSMPLIHAQDLQNCLCEFDKWERVRLGEGKPRSSYPGVE